VLLQHFYKAYYNLCTHNNDKDDDVDVVVDEAKHLPVFVSLVLCYVHYVITFYLFILSIIVTYAYLNHKSADQSRQLKESGQLAY